MADFTEVNRQYFDQKASSYKTDFAQATKLLIKEIQDRRNWISSRWTDTEAGKDQEIKLLEYACGPGTVSTTLAPFVTKVVGIDVSDNMITEFNKNAREAGVSDTIVGLKGDLLAETAPTHLCGPELFDFDLVVINLALHHFADPELAMNRLRDRLKKGGTFLIVDLFPDEQSHHNNHHLKRDYPETAATIKKHGFTQDQLRKLYEDAGVGAKFDYQIVEKPMEFMMKGREHKQTLFIARAERV